MTSTYDALMREIRDLQARLDSELTREEAYRALRQLLAREAGGEPLGSIDGARLRATLESELAGNRFFAARSKLDDAMRVLSGELDATPATAVPVNAETAPLNPEQPGVGKTVETLAASLGGAAAGQVAGAAANAAKSDAAGTPLEASTPAQISVAEPQPANTTAPETTPAVETADPAPVARPAYPVFPIPARELSRHAVDDRELSLVSWINAQDTEALAALGVETISQIANWLSSDVARAGAVVPGGVNRISAENWIEQAALLKAGTLTSDARRQLDGHLPAVVANPALEPVESPAVLAVAEAVVSKPAISKELENIPQQVADEPEADAGAAMSEADAALPDAAADMVQVEPASRNEGSVDDNSASSAAQTGAAAAAAAAAAALVATAVVPKTSRPAVEPEADAGEPSDVAAGTADVPEKAPEDVSKPVPASASRAVDDPAIIATVSPEIAVAAAENIPEPEVAGVSTVPPEAPQVPAPVAAAEPEPAVAAAETLEADIAQAVAPLRDAEIATHEVAPAVAPSTEAQSVVAAPPPHGNGVDATANDEGEGLETRTEQAEVLKPAPSATASEPDTDARTHAANPHEDRPRIVIDELDEVPGLAASASAGGDHPVKPDASKVVVRARQDGASGTLAAGSGEARISIIRHDSADAAPAAPRHADPVGGRRAVSREPAESNARFAATQVSQPATQPSERPSSQPASLASRQATGFNPRRRDAGEPVVGATSASSTGAAGRKPAPAAFSAAEPKDVGSGGLVTRESLVRRFMRALKGEDE